MAQEETTTIDQLNEEADIAADYLEGLLDIARLRRRYRDGCSQRSSDGADHR